jgi:hypothetical protein
MPAENDQRLRFGIPVSPMMRVEVRTTWFTRSDTPDE